MRWRHVPWVLVLALAGCGGSDSAGASGNDTGDGGDGGDAAGLPGGGWSQRRLISIDDSVLGLGLTDVPVLVKVDSTRVNYDLTNPFTPDIRFYDGALQTELAFEVERWNPEGTSYVWVRLDAIDDSDAGRAFYMYSGKDGLADAMPSTEVWRNGFIGVWHMADDGSGVVLDSTGNGHDGAFSGGGVRLSTAELLGSALGIDASGSYLEVEDADSLFPGQVMTLEGWAHPSLVDDGAARSMIRKRDSFALQAIGDMTGDPGAARGVLWFETAADRAVTSDTPMSRDAWTHVAMTYDGGASAFSLWIDGVRTIDREPPPEQVVDSDQPMEIGLEAYGLVDEIRISNVVRDEDWMSVQMMSMTDELLSYGNPQVPPSG